MKNIYLVIILTFSASAIFAQQSFEIPHNYDNQFINNPAATGIWERLDLSTFYSKTFTNVENAPTIIFGTAQYAVPNQNAAFGLNVFSEKAGLLRNTGVNGTFAYKLRAIANRKDFLSLGIGMRVSSIRFAGSEAIVSQVGEPNLGGDDTGFGINFQAGVFYSSSSEKIGYRGSDDVIFQGGVSISQVGRKTNFGTVYDFQEEYIMNGFISTIFAQNSEFILQSYLESTYGSSGGLNLVGGGRATLNEAIIIGASLDSHLALGLEFGFNFKSVNDNISTAIVNFNLPFNDISNYVNPGVGIMLKHQVDLSTGW